MIHCVCKLRIMDLEQILRQKAAAKAERQETAAQAEERLLDEEAAAEEGAEGQSEEVRFEALREQVAVFDGDIAKTEELLKELAEVHGGAQESVGVYQEQAKQHDEAVKQLEQMFEDPELSDVLKDEGINTVGELLAAADYAEISDVKTAIESGSQTQDAKTVVKEKIKERVRAKQEAHAALATEHPELTLTYNELTTGLQDRIESLGKQRNEAFWQTPEGQEAKREALKTSMTEKISQLVPEGSSAEDVIVAAEQIAGNQSTLQEEISTFGEGDVNAALHDVLRSRLDSSVEEEYYRKNLEAQRDVSAEKKYSDAKEGLSKFELSVGPLLVRGSEVQNKLAEYFNGSDGERMKIVLSKNYFNGKVDASAEQVIKRLFTKQLSPLEGGVRPAHGHNNEEFNGSYDGSLSTVEYLKSCAGQEKSMEYSSNLYAAFKGEARVPDPELLFQAAKAQGEMLDVVEAFLDSPDRGTSEAMGKLINEDLPSVKERTQMAGVDFKLSPVEGARDLPASHDDLQWSANEFSNQLSGEKKERQRELQQVLAR